MAGYLTVWTWGSVEAVGVQSRKKKRRAVAKKGAEKVICSDVIGPRAARSVSKSLEEGSSARFSRSTPRAMPFKADEITFSTLFLATGSRCFFARERSQRLLGRDACGDRLLAKGMPTPCPGCVQRDHLPWPARFGPLRTEADRVAHGPRARGFCR